MWIVANGAPKNGSTWLMQLVRASGDFRRIPDKFQNPRWANSSVADAHVEEAAEELSRDAVLYMSKQHWAKRNAALLAIPGFKLMNIIRDARDSVISRYHHDVRLQNESLPLGQYIEKNAERILADYCAYQDYWITAARAHPENYLITSYEYLSSDLFAAGLEVYKFIGVEADAKKMEEFAAETHFSKKKAGAGEFFRKGKAFAFKDEITPAQEQAILDVCAQFDLLRVKREIVQHNQRLEKYLEATDVGL